MYSKLYLFIPDCSRWSNKISNPYWKCAQNRECIAVH